LRLVVDDAQSVEFLRKLIKFALVFIFKEGSNILLLAKNDLLGDHGVLS